MSETLESIYDRLSPRLLDIENVRSVGISGDKLSVIIIANSEDTKKKVGMLVETEAPGTALEIFVTIGKNVWLN